MPIFLIKNSFIFCVSSYFLVRDSLMLSILVSYFELLSKELDRNWSLDIKEVVVE